MLRNYLLIALRNLYRQKGYALINVAGLAIGIVSCLLIVLYVADERSYDRFHEKGNRIYRLFFRYTSPNGEIEFVEDNVMLADSNVFEVFSFDIRGGDPSTALNEPFTCMISSEVAGKFFGEEDPEGKSLQINTG